MLTHPPNFTWTMSGLLTTLFSQLSLGCRKTLQITFEAFLNAFLKCEKLGTQECNMQEVILCLLCTAECQEVTKMNLKYVLSLQHISIS